jgi:hypothetical protein
MDSVTPSLSYEVRAHMQSASDEQIAFGRRLGRDLKGKSVSEGLAMIRDIAFVDQSQLLDKRGLRFAPRPLPLKKR